MDNHPPQSKWRQRLWPYRSFELKKILPLFFLKFFIALNYGLLASLKDTIVVTEKHSGAEVIPLLKGWIVLPTAILATLLYAKLSNALKRSTLFYGIILSFIGFLFLYGFFLYPMKETFALNKTADYLLTIIGKNHSHWIAVIRYWMHSLFFVVSELWGSLVICMLFWGFANEVNRVDEAKRFYSFFAAGGNLAAMSTGPVVWYYTKKLHSLDFTNTLQTLISYVILFGLVTILIHYFTRKYLLKNSSLAPETETIQKKTKLSLQEGLRFILKSKTLLYIAGLVICYGLCMNLIEVTYKAHLKMYFPNPNDYQSFMGTISFSVGLIAFVSALFMGSNIMRYFGWRKSALIAPFGVGITGLIFLSLVLINKNFPFVLGASSLSVLVIIGAIQNISSKAIKYNFFDTTKEMAYIPLDIESKVKGKAAIDIVGSRLGKSGSAWIQVLLIDLIGTGSVISISPFLIPIIAISMITWIFSVNRLSTKVEEKSAKTPEKTTPLLEV